MKAIWLAVLSIVFAGTTPTAAQDFGNQSIVTLTQAGIGQEVLLAKIQSLPCSYDVSTNSILALKEAGVANTVIAAMVERCIGSTQAQGAVTADSDPASKRSAGLYIDQGTDSAHQLVKLRPTSASGGRTTGNGSILFPIRVKLAIPRVSAQTIAASASPRFYFYFEADDPKVGDFGTSATISAQSPSEFSLVRFKEHDGQREMVIGKQKMFGASVGIDPKDAIQFAVEEIGDGIFAVGPIAALKPGEYGFVLRAGSDSYRIYDFGVPGGVAAAAIK